MTNYFYTPWHVISMAIIVLLGGVFALSVRRQFNCGSRRALLLYFWHLLFCVIYAVYVINNGGDAVSYYLKSIQSEFNFRFGTQAIVFLTALLTQGLGLSFLGCFFVFHIFGYIGLLAFDGALRVLCVSKPKNIKIFGSIIVFLPSVSFWSSAIGKDAISFMAVGLALWASLNLSKRISLMVLSVLLMLLVRPHMAGLMVIALALSFAFQKTIPIIYRILLTCVSSGAMFLLVPYALIYAGVGESVSIERISDYIDVRQSVNTQGGGGVDLGSMSLPMQLFTYMFRPLPFEAHSITSLVASLDNVLLFFVFIVGFFSRLKRKHSFNDGHNRLFMWCYLLSSWCVLALTSANLGIAVRQKWMIVPMFVFLLFSFMGKQKR